MANRPVLIELHQPPITDQSEFVVTARLSPMAVTMEVYPSAVNIPGLCIWQNQYT